MNRETNYDKLLKACTPNGDHRVDLIKVDEPQDIDSYNEKYMYYLILIGFDQFTKYKISNKRIYNKIPCMTLDNANTSDEILGISYSYFPVIYIKRAYVLDDSPYVLK